MTGVSHWFDRLKYPITDPHYRIKIVEINRCPECGYDLDTGWECLRCEYDARPIAYPQSRKDSP